MKKNLQPVYCGIIAPIIFVLIFTIEGAFRDNYSPIKNFISELSLGERGWIQIVNFLIFGFLLFVFSFQLIIDFRKTKLSVAGPVLLLILSVCFFFSGPFVTDPNTIFADQKSIHGIIHGVLGGLVFLIIPINLWVFLKLFKKIAYLNPLKNVTLFFAITSTIFFICFTYVTKVPAAQNIFSNCNGLFQRFALIPFMVWLVYFAYFIKNKMSRYAWSPTIHPNRGLPTAKIKFDK